MSTLEWIAIVAAVLAVWVGNGVIAYFQLRSERRSKSDREYIRKGNADFFEAMELWEYGAQEEAKELLKPYHTEKADIG